jgi:GNAT superfamily N-acetyltransferase
VTIEVVSEQALDPRPRALAGRLLAAEWGPAWADHAYAGDYPPEFRVLDWAPPADLAGHVSAFSIPTSPPLRLYGIGDLVVDPRARRRGLAMELARRVTEESIARGADAVLVDTLAAEDQFRALGFEPTTAFFYMRDGQMRVHEHWLVRWLAPAPTGRIELLEHGDF